jgi:uncharacterized lipoprotein YmbA
MPAALVGRCGLVLLVALAGACRVLSAPRPESTRFYTLAQPVPPHPRSGANTLVLGLGPITFPAYLDQSQQLVVRLDDERVSYASADRWASPLRVQFERALALRLMAALDTEHVTTFPWWPGRPIDRTVELTVVAFETDTTGYARLDALWSVKDGKREQVLDTGQVTVREPVDSGGAEAGVAALDRALVQLAQAIAADVRRAR